MQPCHLQSEHFPASQSLLYPWSAVFLLLIDCNSTCLIRAKSCSRYGYHTTYTVHACVYRYVYTVCMYICMHICVLAPKSLMLLSISLEGIFIKILHRSFIFASSLKMRDFLCSIMWQIAPNSNFYYHSCWLYYHSLLVCV